MSRTPRAQRAPQSGAHAEGEAAPAPASGSRTRHQSDIRSLLRAPRQDTRSTDANPSAAESRLAPDAAARRIVEARVEAGADTFFGIPGGPAAPLFEAVRTTAGAHLVESRHESAAAFAAATFHRSSGRTPCLLVTAGPGITNAVTGIVSAHLEGIPMLVISGDVAWASHGARLAQDSGPEGVAVEQMLAACCRASVRVAKPASAATQALAALRAAGDPQGPGPALLVVPIDRAAAPAPAPCLEAPAPHFRAPAPRTAVETAARWLSEAERPLLVLGGACRPHAAIIRQLVDALGVPFVTTPRAKGVVSEVHPRSLRNGGMAASIWARRYTREPIDVALVLGTDLDDTSMGPTPYLGPGGRLIHVDLNANVFRRNLPTALPVVADLGEFSESLYRECVAQGLFNDNARRLMADARATAAFDTPDYADDTSIPVAPHRAIADLERAAPTDARFITDIGEHMLHALHYLTAHTPDTFTIQLNLGSMGSGIAGAIGLALADRERLVVCICGDGGMQMFGMEALVAIRERLPIVFAVFNDARYNMVHHGMKQIFGGGAEWDTPPIDFCTWAESFGLPAARVDAPGEIDSALLARLAPEGGPMLLDIRIDREQRIRGGGRVEALQHMSMLDGSEETER